MMKKCLVIGIICLFMLPSIPLVVSDNVPTESFPIDDMFDDVELVCRGPYLFDVIVRSYVVELKLRNHGEIPYNCNMKMYVTNLFGKDIFDFDPVTDHEYLRDNFQINWRVYTFRDFREAKHLFGFININVEITLYDDGEHQSKEWIFHGLIFGISAIILNPNGI